jgi:hypothetical protein
MIIPPTWTLPEAIKTRIGQTTYGRQRAIVEEGHLLLVLHRPPGADDSKRDGVLFWRNPAGEWLWSRGNNGANGLTAHIQSYADIEAQLTAEYEKGPDIMRLFDLVESLTPLTRAASNMHGALQAAREELGNDKFIIESRDRAYEVDRNLSLLLEDTRNAIQFRAAREAEEQARLTKETVTAGHRLNVLAALFLPLTAIASIFGMNFRHGISDFGAVTFWIVTALGAMMGFAFKSWVLGRADSGKK